MNPVTIVYTKIADLINKHPAVVAGVIATLLIICMIGATHVTMKTGSDTYLDKTTPVGSLMNHYENNFGSGAVILIIEGNDLLHPDVLNYLNLLEKDLRTEKYVTEVITITDYLKTANGGTIPSSSAEVTSALALMPAELLEKLYPSKAMSLGIVQLDPSAPEDADTGIMQNIESAVAASEPPPGITITVSGSPAFSVQMKDDMSTSMGTLIGLAILLMIIAMGFLFGHVRYRFLPVAIVFCGIITTFGVMGIFGIPVSMIVVAAFPVIIGIGIDYAIQFQSRFDEEIGRGSLSDAVLHTVTRSGPSILTAMIATALGFVALMTARVPMIRDFGTICIIGIACCYLISLVAVPTFCLLVKYRQKEHKGGTLDADTCQLDWDGCDHDPTVSSGSKGSFMARYDTLLGNLAVKIAKNPIPILLALTMIWAVGIQLDERVPIDTDEDSMVSQSMPAKIDMDKVTRTMGSTSTITLDIRSGYLLDVDTLTWIYDFSQYAVGKHNEITGATSIASLVASYNGGVMPTNQEELEAILKTIPPEQSDSYLEGSMEGVIEFSLIDLSIPDSQTLIKEMQKDLTFYHVPPGITASFTGTVSMFTDMIDDIKETKNPMTYLGLMLILLFLILVYKRVDAIAPLIPIIMIIGWNSLIMYAMGLAYSLLTATLGAMTIGVASEYTILIYERYEEEKAKGYTINHAIRTSIQKIGTAVSVSGLTTVFGFSALIVSTSPVISNFGLVTVLTVGFSLIGAIVVMPAVISVVEHAHEWLDTRKQTA